VKASDSGEFYLFLLITLETVVDTQLKAKLETRA